MTKNKNLYVFMNGYGMVKFHPDKMHRLDVDVQFKGKIKLPKGIYTNDGKKWIKHKYWYDLDEIYDLKERSELINRQKDPTDIVTLPITNNPIEELRNKIAELCLEYANMGSTNNQAGSELLFKIQELAKALNSINYTELSIVPDQSGTGELSDNYARIKQYLPHTKTQSEIRHLEAGYYWVRVRKDSIWEVFKYENEVFYDFNTDKKLIRYNFKVDNFYEIGEKIEHK